MSAGTVKEFDASPRPNKFLSAPDSSRCVLQAEIAQGSNPVPLNQIAWMVRVPEDHRRARRSSS